MRKIIPKSKNVKRNVKQKQMTVSLVIFSDFLGGFHKRKLQRKKKAAEELQQQLKDEKKRIKQDAREKYKTLLSQRDVPELEELLSQQEYEDDDKTVSILELNVAELAQRSNWIGTNQPVYEEEAAASDDENSEDDDDDITGMSIKAKPPRKFNTQETKTNLGNTSNKKEPETKKEVARAVKKAVLKRVGTSRVFKHKERLDRQKNKKLASQLKRRQEQILKKGGKGAKKLKKRMARTK